MYKTAARFIRTFLEWTGKNPTKLSPRSMILEYYIQHRHNRNAYHHCKYCGAMLRVVNYRDHLQNRCPKKKIRRTEKPETISIKRNSVLFTPCKYCGASQPEYNYENHLINCHKNPEAKTCEYCQRTVSIKEFRRKHLACDKRHSP